MGAKNCKRLWPSNQGVQGSHPKGTPGRIHHGNPLCTGTWTSWNRQDDRTNHTELPHLRHSQKSGEGNSELSRMPEEQGQETPTLRTSLAFESSRKSMGIDFDGLHCEVTDIEGTGNRTSLRLDTGNRRSID